ncbi:MAG: hypothetical protein HYU41_15675 [Candidatus Rokubacteria bacterium]|nr:hypothetical protein [Candidatus Rokubacteria bacterium]
MATISVRRILFALGIILMGIAAERFLNMVWIGRPLDSFTTRAWVFQFCAVAGVTSLLVATILGPRR